VGRQSRRGAPPLQSRQSAQARKRCLGLISASVVSAGTRPSSHGLHRLPASTSNQVWNLACLTPDPGHLSQGITLRSQVLARAPNVVPNYGSAVSLLWPWAVFSTHPESPAGLRPSRSRHNPGHGPESMRRSPSCGPRLSPVASRLSS